MKFTQEQLNDIRYAIKWYQQHNVSLASPRYKEYEEILKLLENNTSDPPT